jgi:uncharacterized protein (DUF1800 family)
MGRAENDFLSVRFALGPEGNGDAFAPDRLLASLANPAGPLFSTPSSADRIMAFRQANQGRAMATGTTRADIVSNVQDLMTRTYVGDMQARIGWGAVTQAPFVERLLAFWSNHFSISARKQIVKMICGPYECEALLPHLGGTFADLLKSAVRHPAMLAYLDQTQSVGPHSPVGLRQGKGLNENLAREILELHTLGVHGGYTQTDVTEFARIMCGWTIDYRTGTATFTKRQAEPGPKTLLGRTYGGGEATSSDFTDALDALAKHPATAGHIARKLAIHFIADSPPPDVVAKLEQRFNDTGGNLTEVYRVLVNLSEASRGPLAKARNDRDFLIAALRAAQVPPAQLQNVPEGRKFSPLTTGALSVMRQAYWSAASPAGWPEDQAEWLSPIGLAGRLAVIPRIVRLIRSASPGDLLDRALGAVASERTRNVIALASNRNEALGLVFASPEFNRR